MVGDFPHEVSDMYTLVDLLYKAESLCVGVCMCVCDVLLVRDGVKKEKII